MSKASLFRLFSVCVLGAGQVALAQGDAVLLCQDLIAGGSVVVVDPYSAGNLLAPEFTRRGLTVRYLKTHATTPAFFQRSFRETDFREGWSFDGDYPALLARYRQMNVRLVLPGTETGVPLADRLSEDLGLPTNGSTLSQARRHKGHTGDRMREMGLPFIPQIWGDDFDRLKPWIEEELKTGPVIVKPVESAGTDDVYLCWSVDAAKIAFYNIRGKTNLLGLPNLWVIAQRFMNGDEYNLDVVTSQGKHRLAWIWKYHLMPSPGASHIVDWVELMNPHGAEMDGLVEMAYRAVDALGVRFGPTHMEFFMTPTGPVLLEAGTRIGGVLGPPTAVATDADIVKMVGDAYLNQAAFVRQEGSRYTRRKFAAIVGLNNFEGDRVVSTAALEWLKTLPSFHHVNPQYENGVAAPRTVGIATALGFVQLIHESEAQVREDYRRIREREKSPQGFVAVPRGNP